MVSQKEYFTTGEVSQILGISPRTIQNYCDNGKLLCEQTPLTNYRRIRRESLIAFMKQNNLPLDLIDKVSEKRILIVDDDEDILELISELLRSTFPGTVIETATDGYEACVKAGVLVPDIIVLDLHMPKADGFEVCKSIREVEQTKYAEIIVVSGYLDEDNRAKLLDFGVSYMLAKPFRPEELPRIIKQIYSGEAIVMWD